MFTVTHEKLISYSLVECEFVDTEKESMKFSDDLKFGDLGVWDFKEAMSKEKLPDVPTGTSLC